MAKDKTLEIALTEHRNACWMCGYFAGAGSAFLVSLLLVSLICTQF